VDRPPFRFFQRDEGANEARWILFVAFFAILANIPFWVASRTVGLVCTGYVCLEYAAVGLLALFIPRFVSAILLFLAIGVDLLSSASQSYYLSPFECLSNLGSVHELSTSRLHTLETVVVLALIATAIAALFPSRKIRGKFRKRAAIAFVALPFAFLLFDGASVILKTGRVPNPFKPMTPMDAASIGYFKNPRLSRLPSMHLVHSQVMFSRLGGHVNAAEIDTSFIAGASADAERAAGLYATARPQALPNLVLIVVESWGLAKDTSLRSALAAPYLRADLQARYEVSQGTVPFYGSTIAAEARELCESKMGFHILDASAKELQHCLPQRLASLGYHDIAVHGMDGNMFRRFGWYSNIGFKEYFFRDQFEQQGLPDCAGAFTGTCDAAIAKMIGLRLQNKSTNPNFIYWVTLNSHLPVPLPPQLANPAQCSFASPELNQASLCSWFQLVSNVQDSIVQLASADFSRPTIFAIVGDHAPPFSDPVLRDEFSDTEVPYFLLVPRPPNKSR